MRTTTRATLATVVAALVLAGCGGDPEPRIADPSPSPTTETSAAADPTPPPLPDDASENTRSGAVAFTKHYWDLANYAQETGEVAELETVSSPTCSTCTSARKFVKGIYRRGGSIDGGDYSVTITKVTPLFAGELRSFDVRFETVNTEQVVSVPGEEDVTYGSETTEGRFVLGRANDSWRVDIWEIG